jgi:hypothetical protein
MVVVVGRAWDHGRNRERLDEALQPPPATSTGPSWSARRWP